MDDFKHKTAHDLYVICQRDYALTMKTYYTLKKNGVMFEDWEDKYLFEIPPKKKTSLIWQKYEISTVSQFSDYNKEQLKEMTALSPKLLDTIGHFCVSKLNSSIVGMIYLCFCFWEAS